MEFGDVKALLVNYFDIDYRIACAIAIVVFGVYYIIMLQTKYKQKNKKKTILKKDIVCGILLSSYISLLISWTIVNRSAGMEYQIKFIPFWSYAALFRDWNRNLAIQIINNILVFIPWGILFPIISKTMQKFWWLLGSTFCFSTLIELIQLVSKSGLFEFDDMFHNCLGAVLGYVIWYRMKKLLSNIKEG